ncbi:MAG: electron transfer flavoprotein subunit alpha/FixB family protein [Deltaproteobacteria bacterium]|nr:electron transfer flavoprotein subunit alpha/FixB family protein [Candidatus Anaeroferrophillacea bacterium]
METPSRNVMVFIEARHGEIADVSRELLSAARRLATELDGEVEAVALGHGLGAALTELGCHGCRRVYYIDDSRLAHFSSVPYARETARLIRKYDPQIVLFGATTMGRDVAPRVASELRCGLTADCTALEIGDHAIKDVTFSRTLMQIRPAFGGNIIATIVSPESRPSMATVREGVMQLDAPDDFLPPATVMTEPCVLEDDAFLTEVLEVVRQEKAVNLPAAQIIVAAGMGAGDPDSLSLVRELAKTLGGQVGCSRPVVDAGVLPKEHQVGQTGITVRPNLYIACGISGQIQHRAGMAEAKRIIAVNRDPQAPIFSIAHYGIVGDVREVLGRMIKAYKTKA